MTTIATVILLTQEWVPSADTDALPVCYEFAGDGDL